MKFIITESQKDKIDKTIYDYINNLFPEEINYEFFDEDGNTGPEKDYDSIDFYDSDWNSVFRIYFESYFKNSRNFKDKHKFPYIELENEFLSKLDGYFGDRWHSVFQNWFDNKFPELNLLKFAEFDKYKKPRIQNEFN